MERIKQVVITAPQEMGVNTSRTFSGETNFEAVGKLYSESAELFAGLIDKYLPEGGEYRIADLGAFKGELMREILKRLNIESEYKILGVDVNADALAKNDVASEKITASLDSIPLPDKSVEISIARYVLVWNSAERQRDILKEICRITKTAAIVQHAGADSEAPEMWRAKMDDLLDGEEVVKLKRGEHYFSSREEIEQWLQELGIRFIRVDEVSLPSVSDVFIERFSLDETEAEEARRVLGEFDYIIKNTWVILPKE